MEGCRIPRVGASSARHGFGALELSRHSRGRSPRDLFRPCVGSGSLLLKSSSHGRLFTLLSKLPISPWAKGRFAALRLGGSRCGRWARNEDHARLRSLHSRLGSITQAKRTSHGLDVLARSPMSLLSCSREEMPRAGMKSERIAQSEPLMCRRMERRCARVSSSRCSSASSTSFSCCSPSGLSLLADFA